MPQPRRALAGTSGAFARDGATLKFARSSGSHRTSPTAGDGSDRAAWNSGGEDRGTGAEAKATREIGFAKQPPHQRPGVMRRRALH